MQNNTTAVNLRRASAETLQQIGQDPQKYAKFLRFQGRIFKHNPHIALAFFSQNPDADFIATREQWESLHYTVTQGAKAVRYFVKGGKMVDLFDFSQIKEETPPFRWAISRENVNQIKAGLGVAEQDSVLMGALRKALTVDQITDCMRELNIPPQDYDAFRLSYVTAVQTIMAGRLEIGGGKFPVRLDPRAFMALETDEQRLRFLSHTARDAKAALMHIENIINNMQAMERKENYEQNDLRTVDSPDSRRAEQHPGREAAGDSAGAAHEQADQSDLQARERRDRLGTDADVQRNGEQHEVVSGVLAAEGDVAGNLVQAGSDVRDVQHEPDGRGAESGGRAGRDLRNEVDGVHGGESRGSDRGDAFLRELPDSGTVGGQIGEGVQGIAGSAVRGDESASDGELRGNPEMGGDTAVLHGRDSDAGESPRSENESVKEKINRVFEASTEKSADATSLPETDPYLAERQTDEPILSLPDGSSIDLRNVREIQLSTMTEQIVQHDESEIIRTYTGFAYDADQRVIVMTNSPVDEYSDITEEYVSPEEASAELAEQMKDEPNTQKVVDVRPAIGAWQSFADYRYSLKSPSEKELDHVEIEIAEQDRILHDLMEKPIKDYAEIAAVAARMQELQKQAEKLRQVISEKNATNSTNSAEVFRIYQIKAGAEYHGIRFEPYADNKDKGLNIGDYDMVYEGDWNAVPGDSVQAKLERIYFDLSSGAKPYGFTGHSVAVSDVIATPDGTAFYVDKAGFAEMPEFSLKLEDKYQFYVIADLKTWANNEQSRSEFEKYATLDEALNRFKELRNEPYNSETALNQDDQPYARLTLGVSRLDRTGDLDILHVCAGENYLVTDIMRSPGFCDDPLFMRAMRRVADEVGFDRVTDYDKLPDGRWSKAIDVSFADWLKYKGVSELVPMPQQPFTNPDSTPARDIHFGMLGNGITAYDVSRTDPETNDYPIVAHISEEGSIDRIADDLSDADKELIQKEADSQREKYVEQWNAQPLDQRYYEIINRSTREQMQQIMHDSLDLAGRVAKYERSLIFGQEEFPPAFQKVDNEPVSLRRVGDEFEVRCQDIENVAAVLGVHIDEKNGEQIVRFSVDDESSRQKLRDAGYVLLMEEVFALNPPKQERIATLDDVVHKFFEGKDITVTSDDGAWKMEIGQDTILANVYHNNELECCIRETGGKYFVEPEQTASAVPMMLVKSMQEHNTKMPTELAEPMQELSSIEIGAKYKNRITGEISEVTSLSGALPWYTEDCTVRRESRGFMIEENVAKAELLNKEKYEFVDSVVQENTPEAETNGTNSEDVQLALWGDPEPLNKHTSTRFHDSQLTLIAPEQPTPDMLDHILRGGASDPHSLERIVAYFQKGKSTEENAAFLREEFGQDGRGYMYDGVTEVAAWFDKDGITAALGMTAFPDQGQAHFSWEQAAERISVMLQSGTFCEQPHIDRAEENELRDIDDSLLFLDRDISGNRILPPELSEGTFPEAEEKVTSSLKNPDTLQSLIDRMQTFVQEYKENPGIIPWYHKPEKLLQQLQDLQIPRADFITQPDFEYKPTFFISDDQKDQLLRSHGSGMENGKFRISAYFKESHTNDEIVKFLKKEYGEGGFCSGGYDEWHSSKGISLSFDGFGKDAECRVLMNWNEVAKRIARMIAENTYITKEDIDRRIQSARYNLQTLENTPENERLISLSKAVLDEYHIPMGEVFPQKPEVTTETAFMTQDGERFVELMQSDSGIDYAIFDGEMHMLDGSAWETENDIDFRFAASQILGTEQDAIAEVSDYATFHALTEEDLKLDMQTALAKLKADSVSRIERSAPTEEEVLFPQANLAKFLAERTPSSDEWEDMAYPLFDRGYVDQHTPSDNAGFGYHLSEPEFYDLAKRYHQGEDIRRELALGLMSHSKSEEIEFVFEQGIMSDRTYYYADNERHTLHTEMNDNGITCSLHGMERFVSFEEIGQAFLNRIHEEYDDLAFWWVRDDMRDAAPDISDERITDLISAFDGAIMHGWENGEDLSKINRIKKALYDILGDEEQTEKAFAAIAKNKYHVTFAADNEFILSSIPESKFDAMKPFMPDNIPYLTEVRDGMMAFAVAPDQVKDFRDALEYALDQAKQKKKKPTRAELLYKQFTEQFPDIASGEHTYERYGKKDDESGWEPLTVEHLGNNTYSFMTFFIQNGDLMHDPDFVFRLDHENKRVDMLEYQQDGVPPVGTVYERVEDEHGNIDSKLRAALEENFMQNLKNAQVVGRELTIYDDKNGNRVELTPTHDEPEIPDEPDNSAAEDKTPELRGILNAFSEKHELGMLQVLPEGRSGWKLEEVMADGATHPIGSLYVYEYGKPMNAEELTASLNQLEKEVANRGDTFQEMRARQQIMSMHGGASPLPKVQDLPEIFYAANPSERVRNNISAIRELRRLDEATEKGYDLYDKRSNQYNSREASDARLRQYCGWGGLPQVFDENYKQYEYARDQLKQLLTPEEYAAARASTLNSHYTSQTIIDAMYKAIQNMDLPRDSRILEPSCGTGNFIARMPSSIGQSGVIGVELDSITARLAKYLTKDRENVQIIHSGFEHADLQNNSFDLAIGNVPFGDYNLNDPDYVQDWRIHDAFFRRALDKVAPGGVVAFITSTGTMDKANPKIREYLAERADLIGAIRLPNNAFADAGTKASSDMIFLKKREEPLQAHDPKPDWCYTIPNADGLKINSYFVENPQMILGKMEQTSHFNMLTCAPIEGADLKQQLDGAIRQLNAKISVNRREKAVRERQGQLEPWGKNYTYQLKDNKVYFRMGGDMKEVKTTGKQYRQYEALCGLRDTTRQLLDMQKTSASDESLQELRQELNNRYDGFVAEYGSINAPANRKLFSDDSDFPIICSLESIHPETGKTEKADIFYRRTVNPTIEITSVQTAEEALQVSLDQRGRPDIPYMATLLDREPNAVCIELLDKGLVFVDPEQNIPGKPFSGVVERAEYLSGNVRRKLTMAKNAAQKEPKYQQNVDALQKVIPEDIRAEEIAVRMGCAWIDPEDYTAFLTHLAGRSVYSQRCKVTYSPITGEFDIVNAGSRQDLTQNEIATYGTNDYTMYELAKKILNQRRITVLKEMPSPDDPSKTVTRTDVKASKIAIDKANTIKEEFKKWIFADDARRAKYERRYNDIFNSLVGREYDGSKLTFPGMASDFTLRPHQKNCVARAIYGGNTLAAHVVGAGKSAVMFTTVMKKKELGLIHKACVVVPKPLVEQVANEWRRLYPDARLLTVTNDDLSTEARRNLFTARVATGAFDAVIMSQEQFEKIPMSRKYRENFMRQEIDQLTDIINAKRAEISGKKDYTVKQIERVKKQMEARLAKMLDPKAKGKAKDDLLEFEQLGFDFLCVDECHNYKNGFVTTKMTNVAGVTTRPSGRAEDMKMKTDYFNEQLGQGHLLLCSGTPVSNSMTELYVMTRYLRPDLLRAAGVERFDDWAATFGNVVMKNQQAADGTLKLRTCFSTFANLPELMAMYKTFADVQSAEKLHLPRPELKGGKPQIVSVPASPEQKAYVRELAERAAAIASGAVDPRKDNLLKITGEARLIGLGNPAIAALYQKNGKELPYDFTDSKDSKVDKCIEKVAAIYERTDETRGVQIIFSDIAVNSDNGNFSVYDYIRQELIDKGIPEEEIIFAPKSDAKNRQEIFQDINDSKYRVVIASTGTLGTGANIQQNLVALHHIDVPWKPADFEQREGRILRQGNQNEVVEIYNYVTEGTLDSYLYQTVTDKARFIAQLLDDKCPARVSEDCDEKVLTFGEIQAAAEGNPDFRRRIELSNEIAELKMLQSEFLRETGAARSRTETLPKLIAEKTELLTHIQNDVQFAAAIKDVVLKTADGRTMADRKAMNGYLLQMVQAKQKNPSAPIMPVTVGAFQISVEIVADEPRFTFRGEHHYSCVAGDTDKQDNVQRISNFIEKGFAKAEADVQEDITKKEVNLVQSQERLTMEFAHETELHDKMDELEKLELRLAGLSKQEDAVIDPEEDADPIIETAEERAERMADFHSGDEDDVKPFERRDNDDRMNPPARTM